MLNDDDRDGDEHEHAARHARRRRLDTFADIDQDVREFRDLTDKTQLSIENLAHSFMNAFSEIEAHEARVAKQALVLLESMEGSSQSLAASVAIGIDGVNDFTRVISLLDDAMQSTQPLQSQM